MNRRKLYILLITGISLFGTAFYVDSNREFEITKNLEIFAGVYRQINHHYADDIEPSTLMKVAIDAMLETLDPYTVYYSETQVEGYRYLAPGRYEGIGAQIKLIGDYPTVVESFTGSPALEAGLQNGDKILSVDGQDATGRSVEEMQVVFKGAPGTTMQLQVRRPSTDETIEVELVRGTVDVPNVPHSQIVGGDIAYIVLTTFTQQASKNIARAYRNLLTEQPDLKGVIIDLRNNGGGLLAEAINICNLFVDQGTEVVSTRSKVRERDQHFKTRQPALDVDIPVVVLINGSSASASEIVSGVLQDLDRAVIMGQQSFGKGLVQNTYDLGYNSKLKVTTSKYYIPSGRCIQGLEYKDGLPVSIPESERSAFQTKNGRTVYDGGGISPDVKLDDLRRTPLIQNLEQGNWIFKYVMDKKLDSGDTDPGAYEFINFSDFSNWLQKSDWTYRSKEDDHLNKWKEWAQEEGQWESVSSAYSSLKQQIDKSRKDQLRQQEATITGLIEEEVIARSHHREGRIRQRLVDDPEVEAAVELLHDGGRYEKLLKG